jgi:hypothetical protein
VGGVVAAVRVYPEPELFPVPVYRPQVELCGPKVAPPAHAPDVPLWRLISGSGAVGPLFDHGEYLPVRNPQWGIA